MVINDNSEQLKQPIPVAYAPDDNFAPLTLISMLSVVQNTDKNIEFIILYSSLTEKSFEILNYAKKYKNCCITYTKVSEKIFEKFQNAHWVTIQAWFRILLPKLFPRYDKIIYLDGDTMLRGDISKFYDTDMSDAYVAATHECVNKENLERLQMKGGDYFNSGVMLLNCEKWRKENLYETIKDCAINNSLVTYGDQDALNLVFDEKNKIMYSGNMIYIQTWFWDKEKTQYPSHTDPDFKKDEKDVLIVHFTAAKPNKPQCNHSMKNEWWQIAKTTPYYTEFLEKYQKSADEYIIELFNENEKNKWK